MGQQAVYRCNFKLHTIACRLYGRKGQCQALQVALGTVERITVVFHGTQQLIHGATKAIVEPGAAECRPCPASLGCQRNSLFTGSGTGAGDTAIAACYAGTVMRTEGCGGVDQGREVSVDRFLLT